MRCFRSRVVVSCLVAAALICLGNQALAARGDGTTQHSTIEQKLDVTISVDFEEIPLTEVLDYFRTACDINIVYDPPQYDDVERMVNLNVRNMKAETALRWVTKLTRLDSEIIDNVLYISTPDRVAEMGVMYMRQYDVRDLLALPDSFGGSGNDNDNDDDDNDDGDDDDDGSASDDLLELLTLFTGPGNWDYVEVLGSSSSDDDTESQSREDDF